jgi:hypothetical protein
VPDDRSGEMLVMTLSALYRVDDGGAFELLLDFAAPAPGLGGSFAEVHPGPLLSTDRIGFSGRVHGELASSDEGLWALGASGFELRVREGDAVGAGLLVGGLPDARPVFDAAGRVAFLADTTDAALDARGSILLHDPAGGLSLVAREGAPLPGLLDERLAGPLSPPQMDAAGDVVFSARIESAAGPPAQAIFAVRASGALEVVVRVGQSLEVRPGVWKTVSALAGPDLCFPSTCFDRLLSDAGQLVFRAWFEDETEGVFLAVLPEPRAALLALGALGLAVVGRAPSRGRAFEK